MLWNDYMLECVQCNPLQIKPLELKPCDISNMLIPQLQFQGIVLEGDDIYWGARKLEAHSSKSDYLVHNKMADQGYHRDIVPQSKHGIFHAGEGFVAVSYTHLTLPTKA